VQPEDPLERYGLSMNDFDQLLSKYQSDPEVRNGIAKIMGVPDSDRGNDKTSTAKASRVVEVHCFMEEELSKVVKYFNKLNNKDSYDVKLVTLAAQAIVGAKVEERFGWTSEDIERVVLKNHEELAKDQEFAKVNQKMRQTMNELVGEGMAP
jgi:hypothetical protein